jgi:hypothetical protein
MQVTFDAADPARLADFWAVALDYELEPPPPGYATWEDFGRAIHLPEERWGDLAAVVDPERQRPRLLFQRVPEGKSAKNRVHLDINVGANAAEHVRKLIAAGATFLREVDEPGGRCTVLQDPEGNEFCVQ